MRQQAVISAGCQQNSRQPCCLCQDYFAYASTLSIYVYRTDDCQIERIINYPESSILCIASSPHNNQELAAFSSDSVIRIWNIVSGHRLYFIQTGGERIETLQWSLEDRGKLLCATPQAVFTYSSHNNLWARLRNVDKPSTNARLTSMQQSSYKQNLLAITYETEKGEGYLNLYNFDTKKTAKKKLASAVLQASWDPCSADFILVLLDSGTLFLYDVSSQKEVSTFTKQPAGMTTSAFFIGKRSPGSFITCSDRNDVLKVWNVAQPNFLKTIRVGIASGLHTVRIQTGLDLEGHAMKDCKVICSFSNGAVALYSTATGKLNWHGASGHTETIFDCNFKTTDPNILATASYDQTVRLWDISAQPSPRCITTFPMTESSVYSVSWSPDGRELAASTLKGEVVVFDADKGTLATKVQNHVDGCYSVKWHRKDRNVIASAGADKQLVICTPSGQKSKTMIHPGGCFGVDWDPFNDWRLAVSCQDGFVYVWNLGSSFNVDQVHTVSDVDTKPKGCKILSGHMAKTFNVAWNPLVRNLLASGSDDKTVRVWNVGPKEEASASSTSSCTRILRGHKSRVRGLRWHTEVPWLLVSGSWDATLRLWDVRDGTCLQVCEDHHSDVYGLTLHPQRPMVVATCSRDTTVRLWNLVGGNQDGLQHVPISLWLQSMQRGGTLCDQKEPLTVDMLGMLAADKVCMGEGIRTLESSLQRLDGSQGRMEALIKASLVLSFWWPSSKIAFLCEAAQVVLSSDSDNLSASIIQGIADDRVRSMVQYTKEKNQYLDVLIHYKHIHAFSHTKTFAMVLQAEASYLETFKSSKFQGVGMGSNKRQEYMREAAKLYLHSGNIEAFCEINIELGEWDKALSLAPLIGIEYWKGLMERKAQICHKSLKEMYATTNNKSEAPIQESEHYLIAGKGSESLVDLYSTIENQDSAFLISSIAANGGYSHFHADSDKAAAMSNDILRTSQPLARKNSLAPLPALGPLSLSNTSPPRDSVGVGVGMGGMAVSPAMQALSDPVIVGMKNRMYEIQSSNATRFRQESDPITAACCRLAMDDVQGAINDLVMGDELELGVVFSFHLLGKDHTVTHAVASLLVRKLEQAQQMSAAKALVGVVRWPTDADEEALHETRAKASHGQGSRAGGEPGVSDGIPAPQRIRQLVLSGHHGTAAACAVHLFSDVLSKPHWNMQRDIDVVWGHVLCINAEVLERTLQRAFLSYVFYIAGIKFMFKGIDTLCMHAFKKCRELIGGDGTTFAVDTAMLSCQENIFLVQSSNPKIQEQASKGLDMLHTTPPHTSPPLPKVVEGFINELKGSDHFHLQPNVCRNDVIPTASRLPSHQKARKSLFTGLGINGRVIRLEDAMSCISQGEAAVWKQVLTYSPLGTGKLLC